MSSIDLVILGMVLEKPQSAYEIQKDVEYHHFPRWTKISVPSVYKKVLQLKEKGYLRSDVAKGDRFAEKAVYSITEAGKAYFMSLMESMAEQPVTLAFDFNAMIANLNKLDQASAQKLIGKLRQSIAAAAEQSQAYAGEYAGIPLTGRTVFDQQRRVYQALLAWLDAFSAQLAEEGASLP
ncbi:MAG: PadR family transcriptional regulator [Firmicutes bacterium]|nr:PadR family transcriptional regulator [Bacillota bacterium]